MFLYKVELKDAINSSHRQSKSKEKNTLQKGILVQTRIKRIASGEWREIRGFYRYLDPDVPVNQSLTIYTGNCII